MELPVFSRRAVAEFACMIAVVITHLCAVQAADDDATPATLVSLEQRPADFYFVHPRLSDKGADRADAIEKFYSEHSAAIVNIPELGSYICVPDSQFSRDLPVKADGHCSLLIRDGQFLLTGEAIVEVKGKTVAKYVGTFDNGKPVGIHTLYGRGGVPSVRLFYTNGEIDRAQAFLYGKPRSGAGALAYQCKFVDPVSGVTITGSSSKGEFSDGFRQGSWLFYDGNNLVGEAIFDGGYMTMLVRSYDETGALRYQCSGGEAVHRTPDGEVTLRSLYIGSSKVHISSGDGKSFEGVEVQEGAPDLSTAVRLVALFPRRCGAQKGDHFTVHPRL